MVIVVDAATGHPMIWQDGQFVFGEARKITTTKKNWLGTKVLSIWSADLLIKSENETRKEHGLPPHKYEFVHVTIGK